MTKTFNIFFSDLNEDAQKRLLKFEGILCPSENNWDLDILPLAIFESEIFESEDCEICGKEGGH
jgi:hypothetical protein